MKNYLKKNYSQDDLRKLINENQNKNNILNKMINSDIYINLISESYQPLREQENYLKKSHNISNRYNIIPNPDKLKIKNFYKLFIPQSKIKENTNINTSRLNQYYIYNNKLYNSNNNNVSFFINKSEYGEKKHFPELTNKGSYLKIVNHHLIPNTERLKLIKRPNINENYKNSENYYPKNLRKRLIQRYNDYNKPNYNYKNMNLQRNSSMLNNSTISRNHMIRNKLFNSEIKDLENNCKFEKEDCFSQKAKHYNRQRYDYEGSRFGDETYNYYLNEPMRGDIKGLNWKFPPLYGHNSKSNH